MRSDGAAAVLVAVVVAVVAFTASARAARAAQPFHDGEDPTAPAPPAASDGRSNFPDRADPPRANAVYGIVGFGAPLGIGGAEYVRRLGPWFELGAGLGAGLAALASGASQTTPLHYLQWAVMPRLRVGDDRDALTLGAGVSGGNYGAVRPFNLDLYCEGCQEPGVYPMRYVVWGNVELGVEVRRRGFAFRAFGGFAAGCTSEGCFGEAAGASLVNPYFGFGFGGAF